MALVTLDRDLVHPNYLEIPPQHSLPGMPTSFFDEWHIEEVVASRIEFDFTHGHWLWRGPLIAKTGYGRITAPTVIRRIVEASNGLFRPGARSILAHRYVFWTYHHWLPPEGALDHKEQLCYGRVHNCCNPTHVEPITSQLNTQRGIYARSRAFDIHPSLFERAPFERGVMKRGW